MSTEETKPGVSLADMALMLQIIDACSTRGAFRGEEMLEVGQLRSRLAAFVQHAQQNPTAPVPTLEADDGKDSKSSKTAS